jgi:hypothetical protein
MAGMGPPPKPPGMRQRRNKTVAGAMLPAAGSSTPAPPLPVRSCSAAGEDGLPLSDHEYCGNCEGTAEQPWHPLVLAWWRDVWASPMAIEFLQADTHGLFVLAELRNQFWRTGDASLAGEIRLQEQRFGLSSLDRRRLQWEVERVEQAQKRRPTPGAVKSRKVAGDPRRFLRAVK